MPTTVSPAVLLRGPALELRRRMIEQMKPDCYISATGAFYIHKCGPLLQDGQSGDWQWTTKSDHGDGRVEG